MHLLTMNVLYPKIVLFWAWIWGAMGLVLAIPLVGATKIICDYIDSLRGLGSVVRQLKFQGNLSIKAFKGFGARLEAAVLGRCEVIAKKEPLPVDSRNRFQNSLLF